MRGIASMQTLSSIGQQRRRVDTPKRSKSTAFDTELAQVRASRLSEDSHRALPPDPFSAFTERSRSLNDPTGDGTETSLPFAKITKINAGAATRLLLCHNATITVEKSTAGTVLIIKLQQIISIELQIYMSAKVEEIVRFNCDNHIGLARYHVLHAICIYLPS